MLEKMEVSSQKPWKIVRFLNLCPHIIHLGSQPNSSWKSAKSTQLHILTLQINFSLSPTPGVNKHHLTLCWFLWWISHLSPVLRGLRGIYEIHGIRAGPLHRVGFLPYHTLPRRIMKIILSQPFTSAPITVEPITASWVTLADPISIMINLNSALHVVCVPPI